MVGSDCANIMVRLRRVGGMSRRVTYLDVVDGERCDLLNLLSACSWRLYVVQRGKDAVDVVYCGHSHGGA